MKKDLLYAAAFIGGVALYVKLRDVGMKPLSGLGRGFRFRPRMPKPGRNPLSAQSAFRFFKGTPSPFPRGR